MILDRQERVKLFVGNLSFFTTSETLIEVFEEFGSVYDCYIPMDTANGNSRGFGFVTMYKDAAQPAIDALDGCELDGRPITVNEAKPRTPRGEEAEEEETENDADSEVADPEAP
jgi:RNA recognition motif-containing protein